jgi:hypothetical protein
MYDPELSHCIDKAFLQLQERIHESGSVLGKRITGWIENTYKAGKPQEAFTNPLSFPVLLLPWYAQSTIQAEPEINFQTSLIYSSVNGYYYIRLMDNLMDAHRLDQLTLLPVMNFFHTQFQTPYQKYFKYSHPFWDTFQSIWMHSAEVTLRDAALENIDRDLFVEVSAQKTCAVKIPLAAVFYKYDLQERIDIWFRFIDLFGCWHQMWNDIFDWIKDTKGEVRTYFLSEAQREKRPREPIVDWVLRAGLAWGFSTLDDWMMEMQYLAKELDSPHLETYLEKRNDILAKQKVVAIQKLEKLGKLLSSLKKSLAEL